ncbi:MAG: hypothetical protein HOM14_15660 [Gammaproteobacteria bacterium]|jgi:hypothetical protein|nr:hypothetical protein [Gammaproteobacteria bacterium]MBT6552784.1 hypothetical protein [Gammaproteobacteria bacterium]
MGWANCKIAANGAGLWTNAGAFDAQTRSHFRAYLLIQYRSLIFGIAACKT